MSGELPLPAQLADVLLAAGLPFSRAQAYEVADIVVAYLTDNQNAGTR